MSEEHPGKRFNDLILEDAPNTGNQTRREVLEMNRKARDNNMGHRDWGSLALNIPELDYYILIHRFPDLVSPDAQIQLNAWKKFMKDPASEPYKVRRNDGKRLRPR